MGIFDRRQDLVDRAVEVLAPFADRDALRGRPARLVDQARLRRASRIPPKLRRRLNPVERARAQATLARIVSVAGERDVLVEDAERYVEQVVGEHLGSAAPTFPFLFAVGPVGTEAIFHLPRADVDEFSREVPEAWAAFTAALQRFVEAPGEVRREAVGMLVDASTLIGNAVRRRRRPSAAEEERLERLQAMLAGREPPARTDTEVAISLCRAYLAALRLRGEETPFEAQGANRPDAQL